MSSQHLKVLRWEDERGFEDLVGTDGQFGEISLEELLLYVCAVGSDHVVGENVLRGRENQEGGDRGGDK